MRRGWAERTLGEVCEFKYGKGLPASARSGTGYAVFGSNGEVGRHEAALTAGATIVVGRKGSFGEVHFSADPCWPIDTTYYIDADSTEADLRWLMYRLRCLGLTKLNRAAAIPGLNREDAYRRRLLVPPIEEQRRIAAALDKADGLRTKRSTSLALVVSLNESILLDMFGDPAKWAQAERPLIELVDPDRPISYGILKPGPDLPGGVPYVRVVDMRLGGIDASSVKRTSPEISHQYRRSLLRTGDLLLSIRGHVGRLAEVPPELDGANITQDTARLAIDKASPRFVLEYLRTTWAQRWMQSNVKGAAVRGINLGDVKRLPVPVFDRTDQDEFVRRARAAERALSGQRRSASTLDDLFASIEHRAFAGQL